MPLDPRLWSLAWSPWSGLAWLSTQLGNMRSRLNLGVALPLAKVSLPPTGSPWCGSLGATVAARGAAFDTQGQKTGKRDWVPLSWPVALSAGD